MKSVASLCPFGVKYISVWKINEAECCSVSLSLISLMSLLLLSNNSNPHVPMLKRRSFVEAGFEHYLN